MAYGLKSMQLSPLKWVLRSLEMGQRRTILDIIQQSIPEMWSSDQKTSYPHMNVLDEVRRAKRHVFGTEHTRMVLWFEKTPGGYLGLVVTGVWGASLKPHTHLQGWFSGKVVPMARDFFQKVDPCLGISQWTLYQGFIYFTYKRKLYLFLELPTILSLFFL